MNDRWSGRSCKLIFLVLFFCAVVNADSVNEEEETTFADILQRFVESNVTVLDNDVTGKPILRLALPCDTPNHDPGFCVPIKNCSVLMKVLYKPNAKKFLIASKCGDARDDYTNPKVCCGKLGHFITKEEDSAVEISASVESIEEDLDERYNEDDENSNPLPKTCGQQSPILASRIYGGTEASIGEFPWMARLIHENKYGYRTFGCSGFLIAPKFVLTAAHCLLSDTLEIRGNLSTVQFGDHNTRQTIDCVKQTKICAPPPVEIRVAEQAVHPNYKKNSKSHLNDIALIHLKKAVVYTDFVQPVCLLSNKNYITYNYWVSGWGQTQTDRTSNVKMKVEIPDYNLEACKKLYKNIELEITDTQICAGGQENKDSCVGDSGGPLMMSPNGSVWFASGVVSYGLSCGQAGWPGVYTSIPHYLPWIKAEMKKFCNETLRSLSSESANKPILKPEISSRFGSNGGRQYGIEYGLHDAFYKIGITFVVVLSKYICM